MTDTPAQTPAVAGRHREDGDAEPAGGPAETRAEKPVGDRAVKAGKIAWRKARPFWGGLLVTLAGLEILATMKAPLPVVIHLGVQGLAGYLVPVLIILCGQLLWWNPDQRVFYSVVAVVCTLASWVTSNLGGFFVGLILGLVGGSLAFAWSPPRTAVAESTEVAERTEAAERTAVAESTAVVED